MVRSFVGERHGVSAVRRSLTQRALDGDPRAVLGPPARGWNGRRRARAAHRGRERGSVEAVHGASGARTILRRRRRHAVREPRRGAWLSVLAIRVRRIARRPGQERHDRTVDVHDHRRRAARLRRPPRWWSRARSFRSTPPASHRSRRAAGRNTARRTTSRGSRSSAVVVPDFSADAATADVSRAFVDSYRLQIAANPKTPSIDRCTTARDRRADQPGARSSGVTRFQSGDVAARRRDDRVC